MNAIEPGSSVFIADNKKAEVLETRVGLNEAVSCQVGYWLDNLWATCVVPASAIETAPVETMDMGKLWGV